VATNKPIAPTPTRLILRIWLVRQAPGEKIQMASCKVLKKPVMLMLVLHAAKLANGNTFAFKLQLFLAHLIGFASLQALGGVFMRHGHHPVTGDVFFGSLVKLSGRCY
jgi:hypothetical protein